MSEEGRQILRRIQAVPEVGSKSIVDEEIAASPSEMGWFAWRVWESDAARLGLPATSVEPISVGGVPQPAILFYVTDFPPHAKGGMHATNTVDFVSVMSGEIVLSYEDNPEVVLRAGDVLVQRGGTHAWSTKEAGCRVSFVMVRAVRSG